MSPGPNTDTARRVAAVLAEMSPQNAEDGIETILDAVYRYMRDDGLTPDEAADFSIEFAAAVTLAMRSRQPTSKARH